MKDFPYTLTVSNQIASVSPPPPAGLVVHFLLIVDGQPVSTRVPIEPDGTAVYAGPAGLGLAAVESGEGGKVRPPLSNTVQVV